MTDAAGAKAGRGKKSKRTPVSGDSHDKERKKRRSVRLSGQRGQSGVNEQNEASRRAELVQEKARGASTTQLRVKRPRSASKSPFFVSSRPRPASPLKGLSPQHSPLRRQNLSCIPFPPLSSPTFGLAQERLRQSPFQLLLACVFLTKTRGAVSMPVFFKLVTLYPTPTRLAQAPLEDVVAIFQHLGLQNQRAKRVIEMAKAWVRNPPVKGRRYRVLNYPRRGDGRDVKPSTRAPCAGERGSAEAREERSHEAPTGWIADNDERVAWEIGQIPGCGAYALDSWRIFSRDALRGTPSCDEACTLEPIFGAGTALAHTPQGEWTTVVPLDKELRAYLRWRWLRHGRSWDSGTGTTRPASESELLQACRGGVMVAVDGAQRETLCDLPSPASTK